MSQDPITDESIKAVAAGCASLTSLDVGHCPNITDDLLGRLRQSIIIERDDSEDEGDSEDED